MSFDPNKTAIITQKALRRKQVLWVLRDEPVAAQDSGWQLFYGDESEDYLDEPKNSADVPIAEILSFAPKLAEVFETSDGLAFEWNDEKQAYVPAEYEAGEDEEDYGV